MAFFRVSQKAADDLYDIGAHTQENWGIVQRDKYFDELNNKFQSLANAPDLGQSYDHIRKGYRACYVGKHVIFYRTYGYGIRIVRILHQKMDFNRHL